MQKRFLVSTSNNTMIKKNVTLRNTPYTDASHHSYTHIHPDITSQSLHYQSSWFERHHERPAPPGHAHVTRAASAKSTVRAKKDEYNTRALLDFNHAYIRAYTTHVYAREESTYRHISTVLSLRPRERLYTYREGKRPQARAAAEQIYAL